MPKIIPVSFFYNGTAGISKHSEPNSVVGKLLSHIVIDSGNIIELLFENCENRAYYFDGPGTDIFCNHDASFSRKMFDTVGGLIYGNWGINSLENIITRTRDILIKLMEELQKASPDEPVELELHFFGWSRGAFFTWFMKKECADLEDKGLIKIKSLHFVNIDSVAGGPFDRRFLESNRHKKNPDVETTILSFISKDGNLHGWPFKVWPFNFNTTFFSGFNPVENDQEKAKEYLVDADHEEIVGKWNATVSYLVLFKILSETKLKFKEEWVAEIKEKAVSAAKIEFEKHPSRFTTNRAHLSPKYFSECYIGKKRTNIPWLHTIYQKPSNDSKLVENTDQNLTNHPSIPTKEVAK